ncbi:hypothetical protein ACP70R_007258 [Stipagrostis hirtigluma subsp. patula]
MEFAAGTGARPAPPAAAGLPGRHPQRPASGRRGRPRLGTAARRRAEAHADARRAVSAAGGHLLPRRVARSAGGGGGGDAGSSGEDAGSDPSSPARAGAPDDDVEDANTTRNLVGDHPGGIRNELMNLSVPAIIGQAIDPVAQLLEPRILVA